MPQNAPNTTENLNIDGARQYFEEQISFFRQKLNLPSSTWDSIKKAAHDRAFIVAGAQKADLLNDLREAVDKVIMGESLYQFRQDFAAAVVKSGWSGWTGQSSKAGVAWRTRIIAQTNIASSYAAGRYQQLKDPELLKNRPYWQYIHNDSVTHPRPLHLAWGNAKLTLLHDHPFWKTHFPPNGWGCGCYVKAVRAPDETMAKEPPHGWDALNPKTQTPMGIDEGWDYQPGANASTQLADIVGKKLITLDGYLGAKMAKEMKPVLLQEIEKTWSLMTDNVDSTKQSRNKAFLVGVLSPATYADLLEKGFEIENAAIWMRDTEYLHATRDNKVHPISKDVWDKLPELLAGAKPYLDSSKQNLIIVLNPEEEMSQRIAINVNYNQKIIMSKGDKSTVRSNFIATGSLVHKRELKHKVYLELKM